MTWLITLARNKTIDRLRQHRDAQLDDEQALALPAEDPTPAALAEASQERLRLERCLAQLDPQQGRAVREAFFSGATYSELAARLRVPLGTMKSWIRRSLMQLKVPGAMNTPADHDPELRCAEYALGVLDADARRELEQSAARDPALQATLERWQRRLAPLADDVTPSTRPREPGRESSTNWASSRRRAHAALRPPDGGTACDCGAGSASARAWQRSGCSRST